MQSGDTRSYLIQRGSPSPALPPRSSVSWSCSAVFVRCCCFAHACCSVTCACSPALSDVLVRLLHLVSCGPACPRAHLHACVESSECVQRVRFHGERTARRKVSKRAATRCPSALQHLATFASLSHGETDQGERRGRVVWVTEDDKKGWATQDAGAWCSSPCRWSTRPCGNHLISHGGGSGLLLRQLSQVVLRAAWSGVSACQPRAPCPYRSRPPACP